jgi:UDP-N-acetylmuramoylalanine--D-glutamate ligase
MSEARQAMPVIQQTPLPAPSALPALEGRQALVLGLGDSGLAMARWLAAHGARLRVADTRDADPGRWPRYAALREAAGAVECVGGALDEAWLDGVELLFWSPGLSIENGASAAFYAAARARGIAVAGELDLFGLALAELGEGGYQPRIVAVTGTNGKTTTTALAAHLCAEAGLSVRSAGNIRPPMLDALSEAIAEEALPQVWVLELSSFQLALSERFCADAATLLNLGQDHLDWHASMESYGAAKQRIFARAGVSVFNRADPATEPRAASETPSLPAARRGSGSEPRKAAATATPRISFGPDAPTAAGDFGLVREGPLVWLAQALPDESAAGGAGRRRQAPLPVRIRRLMPADALRIRGLHNQMNALAALALCSAIDVPMARMLHALRSYQGEAHRCQLIAVVDDVEYYDDSKGTNVSATVAALEGLGRRCRLIAGGDGKGQDFSALASAVARHASGVWLIGRDASRLREALAATGVALEDCPDLPSAVRAAARGARAGDAVLLSPACASLDMFRDYAHRAEVFAQAVAELGAEPLERDRTTC